MKMIAAASILAMFTAESFAQVFVCKEPNGNTTYSGTPCGPNQRILDRNTLGRNNLDFSAERRANARVERYERSMQSAQQNRAANTTPHQYSRNMIVAPEDRVMSPNWDEARLLERQAKVYSNTVNNFQGCPTDVELRNLRVGSSSLTASSKARNDLARAQELARECIANGGNAPLAQATIERRRAAEYADAPIHDAPAQGQIGAPPAPAPTRITSCNDSGCFDDLGGRYTRGQNGNFYNSDAKLCRQQGNRFACN